jgi:hypothetical protein
MRERKTIAQAMGPKSMKRMRLYLKSQMRRSTSLKSSLSREGL